MQLMPFHFLAVDIVQDGGFQSAEAELIVPLLCEGARKIDRGGISFPSEFIDLRPPGIRQPHHARDLVKRLARRIVTRLSHLTEAIVVRNVDERRMPARDDERHKGRREILRLKEICKDMPLKMIDPDERHTEGKCKRFRR